MAEKASRPLCGVEELEQRDLLSADPFLAVITHGFLLPGMQRAPAWATKMAGDIKDIADRFADGDTLPATADPMTVDEDSDFSFPWPAEDTSLILRVSWPSFGQPNWIHTSRLASSIRDFLAAQDRPWDLLLIGHSRGAIFNSELLRKLQGAPNIDYVQMVLLDATASISIPHVDGALGSVVPALVDRAAAYDDGHSLKGVPGELFGLNTPPLFTDDGFDLRPPSGEDREVLNWDVGDLVDEYLISNSRSLCDLLPSGGLFITVLGLSCELGVWLSGVAETAWYHSVLSHLNIHEWYMDSGYLSADTRIFLKAKDPAQTADPGPGDIGAVAPLEPTKPVAGYSNVSPSTGHSADDHTDRFGPRATVVQIGRDVPGRIDGPGDHDWFQFRAVRDGAIDIQVTPLDGRLTPYARFHWDNTTLIQHNTGGGRGHVARIPYAGAEAGRVYFVDVSGAGGSVGSYQLNVGQPDVAVTLPGPAPQPAPSADDYPDTRVLAHRIDVSREGEASVSGAIGVAGDDDWFTFTAPKTGPLVIEAKKPNSSLDSHLRLHNDSVLVAQHNDHIERRVNAGETYWLHVRAGDENGAQNINPGEDPTGRYVLHVSQPDAVAGGSGTDGPPGPLEGWGGVRGVQINLNNGNGNSVGSIDDPADVEWFQIDGANAGFMQIVVNGVNDDLTEFVTAFRSDGGGIDTDSGESSDRQANVCFDVGAGERVIAAVSSHEGRSTGAFTITVTQPPQCPDDDHPDLGEPPRNIGADGFAFGRIEEPNDNDWFEIPIHGKGYLTIQVDQSDSPLVGFLEVSRTGDATGFFSSDDGRDGVAQISFLPEAGMSSVWAKVSSVDGTRGPYVLRVWRTPNPSDDHPDSDGAYLGPRQLAAGGHVLIRGRVEHPGDHDAFRFLLDQPGPVDIQAISLTEGFKPALRASWQTPDHQGDGDTDAGSGRGDRTHLVVPNIMAAPDSWVNVDVCYEDSQCVGGRKEPVSYGQYVLYVWQPASPGDADVDTVGIEASPILLDGTGTGSLPGSPNGRQQSPSMDHAGDKDVFQVRAVTNRPMTVRVSGQDTFLRVYDASGQSIATDHGSGAGGESEITVEANRGDLFYLEASAFNGTDTGAYSVQVSQPLDDHPDAPIFVPKDSQTRDATVVGLDASGFGQRTGQIETDLVGDRDVFQVRVAERGQLTVDVVTTDDQLDTFFRVYDSLGNLVAIDDDSGDGRNSHATFPTFMAEVYQIEVSGYGDSSVGSYRVDVQASRPATVEFLGTYDDFTSGLDIVKWSLQYFGAVGPADLNILPGQLRLVADGRSAPGDATATALTSRAYVKERVAFDLAGEFGGSRNWGYAEVNDGAGRSIRLQMNREGGDQANLVAVSAQGYTELENNAPLDTTAVAFTENTLYHFEIRTPGGEIQVVMDGTVLARYAGTIAPGSFLQFRAQSAAGGDRYAYLTVDNVAGNLELSDSIPFEIPAASSVTSGTYDDFDDQSLDRVKWATEISGVARAEELGGVLRLIAQGPGARTDDNQATLESLGLIQGDIAFDLTARLGLDSNSSFVEITNGTEFIRVAMDSDGASGIVMSVQSNGYTEVENVGPQQATEGTTYHFSVTQSAEGIAIMRDGTRLARFAGSLRLNSVLRSGVASTASEGSQQLQVYDDFDDNSFDTNRWNVLYLGPGSRIDEQNGRLEISGSGGTFGGASVQSTQENFNGAKFRFYPLSSGDEDETRFNYQAEISSRALIIQIAFQIRANISTITVNHVTVATIGGTDYTWELKPAGSNLEIYADGVLRHTVLNDSFDSRAYVRFGCAAPRSVTQKIAVDSFEFYTTGPVAETDRYAELILDNVAGTFQVFTDAVRQPYDDFSAGQLDLTKWHMAGAPEVRGGELHMPLFRQGQPVTALVSTAGLPQGTNIRGFKLGANRTAEPKQLIGWDTDAYMELTNGTDYLRIRWQLEHNVFRVEYAGAYSPDGTLQTVDIPVPAGQIPDGPLAVRERGQVIEVLHNNNVKVTIPGTIRGGSYFLFVTAGNPQNQTMNNPPADFEAIIDNLEFFVDRQRPADRAVPSLKDSSDKGVSDVDHLTNQLSLDFQWTGAGPRAMYPWRQGELLEDGSVAFGEWSELQTGTTARVELPHASIHVFSVRPIAPDGLVGPESSRAVLIDLDPPTVTTIKVGSSSWSEPFKAAVDPIDRLGYSIPHGTGQWDPLPWANLDQIHVQFSEDIGGSIQASAFALSGQSQGTYTIGAIDYDSTTQTATLKLAAPISADRLALTVHDLLFDVAGNQLDGEWTDGLSPGSSGDTVAGGNFQFGFNVLPGDINQSGGVAVSDVGPLRAGLGSTVGDANYSIFADLNGSGAIAVNDVGPLRTNLGTTLPSSEPSLVSAPIPAMAVAIMPVDELMHLLAEDKELDLQDRIGDQDLDMISADLITKPHDLVKLHRERGSAFVV